MKIGRLTILLFGILVCQSSLSQQYNFINYNTSSGLIGNEVYGIFQDKIGAIYITTTAGISIYDGYRFKNFGYKEGLTHDYIKNMGVFKDDQLVFFANTGREAYIFKNQTFYKKISTPNIITQHFKGLNNEDFVCTDIGVYEYINNAFKKKQITTDTSVLSNAFYKYQNINDTFAIALRVFPKNQLDLINTKTKKTVYSIPDFLGFQIFKDSKQRVWVCSDTWGPILLDNSKLHTPYNQIFTTSPGSLEKLMGEQINNAVEDKKGNIWFSTTGKGIAKLLPNGNCEYFTTQNGLLSNYVFKVFIDADDNLWVGSQKGVQVLTDKSTKLYNKSIGLYSDAVYDAIEIDSTKILTSTERSISVINSTTNEVNSYPVPFPTEGYIIRFIAKNKLIYGFTSSRIVTIDLSKKNIFTHLSPIAPERLVQIVFTKNDELIAITRDGVYEYKKTNFIPLINDVQNVRYATIDKKNNLWLSTRKGLFVYRLDIHNENLHAKKTAQQFCNNQRIEVYTMQQDNHECMWAGTKENGIYSLKLIKDSITIIHNYTRENGLTNNKIKCITIANDSTIYCSTITGLHSITTNNVGAIKKIKTLTNIATSAFSLTKKEGSNNLLIAYLNGLIVYTIPTQKKEIIDKKILFTQCTVNDKVRIELFTDSSLQFSNNENNLSFYFSSFTYEYNNCSYYYWLNTGGSANWQQISNSNYVQFNSLAHGSYTLLIKAVNNDDNKEFVISKKFTIKPLWYQHNLFLLFCLLFFLVIAFLLVKYKIKRVKKEAKLKQQIIETEIAALKAQMNPHFIFNCINSIDAFIHSNDKYNATLYLNKFAKLLRNILDSSKQNTVAFSKDIETIKLYIELEELRNENKFKTTIHIDDELLNNDYKVPPLIIQPFVENAILHGLKNRKDNDGILKISVIKEEGKIKYTITDNGIGRAAAAKIIQNKENHYGMQMSYDRVKLFNKEENASVIIYDLHTSKEILGTEVIVKLNTV